MERKIDKERKPKTSTLDGEHRGGGLELLAQLLRVRENAIETTDRIEAAIDRVGQVATSDALPPAAMAHKSEDVGVTKGKLNTMSTVLLGIMAGVFIGLGAMLCTLATTSTGLGFGPTKLLGGLAFCLGLILVVVAGAELFTGNCLMIMGWLSGRIRVGSVLRNWGLVYFANLAGALSLAGLMFFTNQWTFSGNALGANALLIANAKVNLTFGTALARGILCNALVCLAVWQCFGARTTAGKIVAIIFPITAFVAAGFEHSIANMYFIPLGIFLAAKPAILTAAGVTAESIAHLNWAGFVGNLVPVTLGNIIGGSILIGAVYWLSYLRQERAPELVTARPWARVVFPSVQRVKVEKPATLELEEPARSQLIDLIEAKLKEPAALDTGGKALLSVLAKANNDSTFLAKLAENPDQTLKDYDLNSDERAALLSGDIRWIESKLGPLGEPLRGWLTARLAQEKW